MKLGSTHLKGGMISHSAGTISFVEIVQVGGSATANPLNAPQNSHNHSPGHRQKLMNLA